MDNNELRKKVFDNIDLKKEIFNLEDPKYANLYNGNAEYPFYSEMTNIANYDEYVTKTIKYHERLNREYYLMNKLIQKREERRKRICKMLVTLLILLPMIFYCLLVLNAKLLDFELFYTIIDKIYFKVTKFIIPIVYCLIGVGINYKLYSDISFEGIARRRIIYMYIFTALGVAALIYSLIK